MKLAGLILAASVCSSAAASESMNAQGIVDLQVATSAEPQTVVAGSILTITIVMTNGGPDAALDAQLDELPPQGTSYESLEGPGIDRGWDCTTPPIGAPGKISCTTKSFAPRDPVTFTIALRVDWCLGGAQLTSTTIASSANDDIEPVNNRAIATSAVNDSDECDDGNICTLGDLCAPQPGAVENFDLVAAPALPFGWTSTLVVGPTGAQPWRTDPIYHDTAPNAVFTPSAPEVRDSILDSPGIRILSPTAQLSFKNRYNLEDTFDGGVLEIKIDDGPFQDILVAGGTFTSGDYNGTISERYSSPIEGRRAWTGISSGFVPTTVNLPASAFGRTIVLRWRMATDRNLGNVGQWIDSVWVSGLASCHAGTPIGCDDNDACTADSCDQIVGCLHATTSCDDGNACTDDTCDPILQCVHTDSAIACNDHNACTRSDVCRSGACVGVQEVCNDADGCTADACDPAVGCVAITANLDHAAFSVGRVDGRDLVVLAGAWNSCPGGPRYILRADLDRQDPCIDADDFHLFMNAFGHDCAP